VAFLGYRYCNAPNAEQASTAIVTVSPTPIVPTINSTLSLINDAGKVKFSGVVPDEATRKGILDQLRARFGDGNFIGDIKVDPNAKPIAWLGKLGDALKSFNIPGAELSFDGDAIKVGGDIAADLKAKLLDGLKSIFGAGFSLSAINLDIGAAAKEAAAKTMAALGSLTGSYSAADLVKALNMNIINFASGSAAIPADQAEVLKKSAEAIKAVPAAKLEVAGHTDNKGLAAGNLKLSQARAEAVKAFLVKQGVKGDMLMAKGYGDAKPAATNDTVEGRFHNRRIEFSVVP
jgi:outer membrane protein OmpA-like peptidoglycan-associated protein